jgi:DNA-binding MarR family transcriptional regulator
MDGKEGMLLFKDKQAKLILMLADSGKEWYLSTLAKSAEVTYIHTSRFVARCERAGIMESERHGKIKRVFLTEKGKSIASEIQGIMSKINEPVPAQEQKPA